MTLRRQLLGTVLLVVLVTAAVSCSDNGDEAGSGGSAEDTSAAPASTEPGGTSSTSAPVTDPYDGHTSDLYDGTENWICHPDLDSDECEPKPVTVVAPDGTTTTEEPEAAEDPPIDCFYVYPTVSTDEGINSDLEPNEFELGTVQAQVARYQSVCRVFAPVYRQLTLGAIGGGGFGNQDARAMAYGDVVDAWKTYISQYNDGRGVVVIGHSQGAGHLNRLVQDEIDPNPELRDRLVSAILLGGTVTVPRGADVGGDFQEVPACREAGQTGCVISYASFPADSPPMESALFGRADGPDQQALCVNPVELAGGNGLADVVIPREAPLVGTTAAADLPGDTPYVAFPAALQAQCGEANDHNVLLFSAASPSDPRPLAGLLEQTLGPTWGLHLGDANLAQGDLIEVVQAQSEAFTADR